MRGAESSSRFRKLWISLFLVISLAIPLWRLISLPDSSLAEKVWLRIWALIFLYVYINLSALGIGLLAIKRFRLLALVEIEKFLLAYVLGFAILSLWLSFLGFGGFLVMPMIFFSLVGGGALAINPLSEIKFNEVSVFREKTKIRFVVFLRIICIAAVPLILAECLTPVWDYDALLYHLVLPERFLTESRIIFDPEIFRSAYPYLGEMLFSIGMIFDLLPLAKLVNFTYAILFISSAYIFCRRFAGRKPAVFALAILVGAPAFWMWASWASVDFAWGLFELWSVYSVLMWFRSGNINRSRSWLILAGVMSGFAIGVKYLSVQSLVIVAGLIVWKSVSATKNNFKSAILNLLVYLFSAFVSGGWWYIRNLVSTGNPIYPFYLGGPGWVPLEDLILTGYMKTFGTGRSVIDFLLLPYNVYALHDKFSTIGIELIHPVLWLSAFYPILAKRRTRLDFVIVYTLIGIAIWAYTSQVIRFLVPLTALLAIMTGVVVTKLPSVLRYTAITLIAGGMLFNLVFQLQWLKDKGVYDYLLGQMSTMEFLQIRSPNHRTIKFIHEHFDKNERVLFLWDGRGFYCGSQCIADDEQAGAVLLSYGDPPPSALAADLRAQGITHLMLSGADAGWFIFNHDPLGLHRSALNYFENKFFPECGTLVYQDEQFFLYEISCK